METTAFGTHVRWMIRRDLPEVLEIENASFEFAWNEEDFLNCLRQRNCIGMVIEHRDAVIGYMIYELHKTKLQLLNFAVHSSWRRLGVGSHLVAKLMSKLSSHRRTAIALDVRETNLAAQLFFRSQGFVAVGMSREYFADTGEDSIRMRKDL